MIKSLLFVCITGFFTTTSAIFVTNMSVGGYTAETLVGQFVDGGVTVGNVSLVSTPASAGLYSQAIVEAQGVAIMESGVVLSSGSVNYLENNSNTSDEITSYLLLTDNDPDLQSLVNSYEPVYDATILSFDFTPLYSGTASFTYVFGSDEYDEYVNEYNDVFGFFLDGVNVATLPNSSIPVSINTVNADVNSSYFNRNDLDFQQPVHFATEMDGFTVPLTASFEVTVGQTYHLKLGVADARDFQLDSWVLLGKNSLKVTPYTQSVPEPHLWALLSIGILLPLFGRRRA